MNAASIRHVTVAADRATDRANEICMCDIRGEFSAGAIKVLQFPTFDVALVFII